MKTTVEIADSVFAELRRRAARDGVTLRAVFDAALRQYLAGEKRQQRQFRLRDASVPGNGLAPGIREGDWSALREMIYEGRGG